MIYEYQLPDQQAECDAKIAEIENTACQKWWDIGRFIIRTGDDMDPEPETEPVK